MIFVIAGEPSFEELIKEIDRIVPELKEPVIAQIGNGKYIPKNCKWFRVHFPLYPYYKKADIIVSHHGAGTIFEVLKFHKKLICVENAFKGRNPDLMSELSKGGYLIDCKKISDLKKCISLARKTKIKKYKSPKCEIGETIIKFLNRD
ncbi:MAG: hypothetical protein HYT70_00930 [Candidatus Aenigmarchaeota archaeon]|nr:hypothetical protein [Candidatus Aenigmarchaeota archaeon]